MTFDYIIHGGDQGNGTCMYVSDTKDYERLYSFDILREEDRSEDDPSEVHKDFIENIQTDTYRRYGVGIQKIPSNTVTESNEIQGREHLQNIERKLEKDPALKYTSQEIFTDQLNQGIKEKAPKFSAGERVFYLPHKPVCGENASKTKTRMVFVCSARPSKMSNSINECMYTGPALQPNLWDIMVRARMASNLLIGDLQKAFLQTGLKTCDRDMPSSFCLILMGEKTISALQDCPLGQRTVHFFLVRHCFIIMTSNQTATKTHLNLSKRTLMLIIS